MQSMMLSPSRAMCRPKHSVPGPNDGSLSGAPVKQRPFTRLRRLPPARKPPPNVPIPDIPPSVSSMDSQPSSSTSSPFSLIASLPPPPQPPFSPAALPGFRIQPATPDTPPMRRQISEVDDVFSSPVLHRPVPSQSRTVAQALQGPRIGLANSQVLESSDIEYEDDAVRPDSSPVHSPMRW
ncbi:uncharacterized protein EI90DRAFT_3075138 [Cantharellus anzutake]|uniref:uncharacterized protein n=1 Tax=Cantharellus anzutake TaxID=1750568 RepID=UPI0019088F88|nr:uncharacterized protein EI90DRAFT_3075138 [Cantharellus anzutake]KAF8324585.1 hypothetical protein EI90DRAFT_3075138 [Cantharellus anzutake]